MYLNDFFNGTAFDAYDYFGAHFENGGVMFRVYAPHAAKVALTGDFTDWKPWYMNCDRGVWSLFCAYAAEGDIYKYVVYLNDGTKSERCDPYGFGMELRPEWGSVVRNIDRYEFTDGEWLSKRDKNYNKPLNIYELHLGSWRTNEKNENGWFTYDELAEPLIEYLKKRRFTHVEFMPLSEHPADCSWGYQNTGFYAPTSRYGTAEQLMKLIDSLHAAGIGAILDFVPVHFAIDGYALRKFDGTELYEYPDSDVAISEWGTCNFLFNKAVSAVFMQSCADYWLTKYHFDGLRMDAISRAIYWQGDPARGVNPNSVNFFKQMNGGLKARHPDCMLIAEDSTSYEKITAPVEYGGLGFDYKWDLGWMNDTLDYFRTPPIERRYHHGKITFSMMYFYNELYLLPFSHDENVHGKATVIQKMWGDYERKFPQARAMYAYMFTHPGKKLNFMGGEFAQMREWDEKREQDHDIIKYPLHESFDRYFAALSRLYAESPALHDGEYDQRTFEWIMADNDLQNCFIYRRMQNAPDGQSIVCAFNFSGAEQTVSFGAEKPCVLTPLISSDEETYSGTTKKEGLTPVKTDKFMKITLTLPEFTAILYNEEPIRK